MNLAKSQPDDDTIVRGQVIGQLMYVYVDHVIIFTPSTVSLTSRDQTGGVSVVDSDISVTTAQSLLSEHDPLPDGLVEVLNKRKLCYLLTAGNYAILHWAGNIMLIIIPNLPNGSTLPGGCGWVFALVNNGYSAGRDMKVCCQPIQLVVIQH